ncbi:LysR family transcriptional regulator [Intestinibacter sp.]
MDIKQLINFITIVEEGNITKAACKLNISQPPLSNQLKYMEEELGVKLVERGSRKIRLTDAGDLLYKRGKDIVSVFESTLNEVEDFKSGMEGILKIGVVSTCNQFLPNELILPYSIKYPKMKFELYEGNTYQVIDMVEKRIVDLGVVRTPFNDDNLDYIRLRTEPMVAITKKMINNTILKTFI